LGLCLARTLERVAATRTAASSMRFANMVRCRAVPWEGRKCVCDWAGVNVRELVR
jgi:hypothetical protein